MLNTKEQKAMSRQSGNALFLILIAVALFAALSYAITQSGRGSGSVDREQNMILAGQVTQYPAGLRTSVTRMIITGTPASGSTGVTMTAPGTCGANAYCLFDTSGGAAAITAPPPAAVTNTALAWTFCDASAVANGCYIKDVGTNTATSGRDAVAALGNATQGVTLGVCQQILKGLGVTAWTTPPTQGTADYTNVAAAGYTAAGAANTLAGAGIDGIPFGCTRQQSAAIYVYYHALIEQ